MLKMEIIKLIITIVALLIMMLGIIMIYDARKLTKKWFSFHDKNEGSKWFKIGGFVLFIIGILILYFNF